MASRRRARWRRRRPRRCRRRPVAGGRCGPGPLCAGAPGALPRLRYPRMRIGIDIDSTLHDYWPLLEDAARRRFGVELPYEKQVTWEIPELRPEQLEVVVEETHSAERILGAAPYPGAVETVAAWHEAGHYIQVTSHRRAESRAATERWLDTIG